MKVFSTYNNQLHSYIFVMAEIFLKYGSSGRVNAKGSTKIMP